MPENSSNSLRIEIEQPPRGYRGWVTYHIMGNVPPDSHIWLSVLCDRVRAVDRIDEVYGGVEVGDDVYLSVMWAPGLDQRMTASVLAVVTLTIRRYLHELTDIDPQSIPVQVVPFRGASS